MKRPVYNHKPTIKCLECGKKFVRVCSHVWQVHGLTAREYKKLHGLDVKRGIATEEYREVMRDHVFKNGDKSIAKNLIEKGKKSRFKKGDDTNYKRSKQTQTRLEKHFITNVLPASNEWWKKNKAVRITKPCDECGKPVTRTEDYIRKNNSIHTYCSRHCATIGNNKGRAIIKK